MDNKKRRLMYVIVFIVSLLVAAISGTFAYFQASATDNATVGGNIAEFKLGIAVNKVTTDGDLQPILDSSLETALSNSCVIDGDAVVCQIYEITVTKNGTSPVTFEGIVNLSKDGSDSVIDNIRWRRLNDNKTINSSYAQNSYSASNLFSSYTLGTGTSKTKTFYIVVWEGLADENDESNDTGNYIGQVTFRTSDNQKITAKF